MLSMSQSSKEKNRSNSSELQRKCKCTLSVKDPQPHWLRYRMQALFDKDQLICAVCVQETFQAVFSMLFIT